MLYRNPTSIEKRHMEEETLGNWRVAIIVALGAVAGAIYLVVTSVQG